MTEILQNIYNQLASEHAYLSEREFSRDYLGKSETYFAYLKSAGKSPSSDALLSLWRRLNKEKKLCKQALSRAKNLYHTELLQNWVILYEKVSDEVFFILQRD